GEGVGLSAGVGDGVSVSDGDSLGLGVGDAFLRFDFAFDVGLGDGVGEAFLRFGKAVGDGVGVAFFAELFRCLRAGVGVGSRIFLIFVPNDSSAAFAASITPNNSAKIRNHFITESWCTWAVVSAVLRGDSSAQSLRWRCAEDSARYNQQLGTLQPTIRNKSRSKITKREQNYCASSWRIALLRRMPPSKFSSGKFSFGECARQSGNASPISSVSIPRIPRNCDTIGMLPPSRMSAASRSNALRSARCAASPSDECGSVRYHGPLWPVVISNVTPFGRCFRKWSSVSLSSP